MHAFVAIGGGEIRDRETERIDRYALELTGIEQPKVLFIPTAGGNSQEDSEHFVSYYGSLGADVDVLELTRNPSSKVVEDAILNADMIYCGEGNTERAIEDWKQHSISELLEQTKQQQRMQVLGGIGTGANIWFEFYMPEVNPEASETDKPMKVGRGLGLIDNTVVSVHHNIDDSLRNEALHRILPLPNRGKKTSANAYAIGDRAAVVVEPDVHVGHYTIMADEDANAHIVSPRLGIPHRRSLFVNGRPAVGK